jgi:hypothetical protein
VVSVSGRLSFLSRLTADAHELDAVELQSDVARCSADALHTLHRGEFATVSGRLRAVAYNPREHLPTLQAELFDGFAAIDLVWLGRHRIAGIEPGRCVTAKGRVGVHDGRLAIYNPWYELRVPV